MSEHVRKDVLIIFSHLIKSEHPNNYKEMSMFHEEKNILIIFPQHQIKSKYRKNDKVMNTC